MDLSELVSMLKNAECAKDIDRKRSDLGDLVPAVKVMFDYDQQNYMHRFDLWMHSLHTAVNLPRNLEDDMLYLAALFHDIGKPESRCRSKRPEDRNTHYYGHPKKSVEIIDTIIIPDLDRKGYKIPCLDVKRLFYYVRHHDDNISVREARVRRYMEGVSFEEFQNLMLLQMADARAHVLHPMVVERIAICSMMAGKEGERIYRSCSEEKTDKTEIT